MTTITKQIRFVIKGHRKVARSGPAPKPVKPAGRTPRVSKLMALAIRFDELLRDGKVSFAHLSLVSARTIRPSAGVAWKYGSISSSAECRDTSGIWSSPRTLSPRSGLSCSSARPLVYRMLDTPAVPQRRPPARRS